MAGVIQISKIQVRRGSSMQLPNPSLSEGEFGLTLDTGELFIGTPTQPDARIRTTFPYANTQVLTEWSPNIEKLLHYTYRYRDSGMIQRSKTTIQRNLQEVIDERVSVKSYGATGDGITDDAPQIRRAALDTAGTVRQKNDPTKSPPTVSVDKITGFQDIVSSGNGARALYFPAGIYRISTPLVIPPHATWYGDGPDKTIIIMLDPAQSCVAQTCDGALQAQNAEDAVAIAQNTNKNITTELPTNISIQGMSFVHVANQDVVRLFRASDVLFSEVTFRGGWTPTKQINERYNANDDSMAVVIDPLGSATECRNFTFDNCNFERTTWATTLPGPVSNVNFHSCNFSKLFRGITLGDRNFNDAGLLTVVADTHLPYNRLFLANQALVEIGTLHADTDTTPSGLTASDANKFWIIVGNGNLANTSPVGNLDSGSSTKARDALMWNGASWTSFPYNEFMGFIDANLPSPPANPILGQYWAVGAGGSFEDTLVDYNGQILHVQPGDIIQWVEGASHNSWKATPKSLLISSLGLSQAMLPGPRAVRVTHSFFDRITGPAFECMFAPTDQLPDFDTTGGENISAFNRFEKVGRGLDANYDPTHAFLSPVIVFGPGSQYCQSVGDTFDRVGSNDTVPVEQRRVQYSTAGKNMVINPQDPLFMPEGYLGGGPAGGISVSSLQLAIVPASQTAFQNVDGLNTDQSNPDLGVNLVQSGRDTFRLEYSLAIPAYVVGTAEVSDPDASGWLPTGTSIDLQGRTDALPTTIAFTSTSMTGVKDAINANTPKTGVMAKIITQGVSHRLVIFYGKKFTIVNNVGSPLVTMGIESGSYVDQKRVGALRIISDMIDVHCDDHYQELHQIIPGNLGDVTFDAQIQVSGAYGPGIYLVAKNIAPVDAKLYYTLNEWSSDLI